MHYHLLLTEKCNLQCKYCYGKSIEEENELDKKFKFYSFTRKAIII